MEGLQECDGKLKDSQPNVLAQEIGDKRQSALELSSAIAKKSNQRRYQYV